jgi:hypothetical protein
MYIDLMAYLCGVAQKLQDARPSMAQRDFFCLCHQGFAKILSTSLKGVWRYSRHVWSGKVSGLEMAAKAVKLIKRRNYE